MTNETSLCLSKDKLPLKTIEKLKKLYMLDEYNLLQRSLEVLIRKNGSARSIV